MVLTIHGSWFFVRARVEGPFVKLVEKAVAEHESYACASMTTAALGGGGGTR
jgi:hypothetical protein